MPFYITTITRDVHPVAGLSFIMQQTFSRSLKVRSCRPSSKFIIRCQKRCKTGELELQSTINMKSNVLHWIVRFLLALN